MKKFQLNGRGLFVFSDPGGAKPCLSYIFNNKISDYFIISDRNYSFYKDFNLTVKVSDEIAKYFSEFKPDYLFTATSYTSNIEKNAIKIANKNKIPCITYIDHSTNILNRFVFENEINLPTKILVSENDTLDEINKLKYFKNCEIFKITNPYHTFLSNWKPTISKNFFLESLKIINNKKIILIAFDPISNLNGIEKYGFDEIIGINELTPIINAYEKTHTFIFKPHPNQNLNLLKNILSSKITIVPSETDTINLIYFSDIIIGFFSNILLEANVFNKKIIRYRPEGFKFDPFHRKNLGVIANKKTLTKYI